MDHCARLNWPAYPVTTTNDKPTNANEPLVITTLDQSPVNTHNEPITAPATSTTGTGRTRPVPIEGRRSARKLRKGNARPRTINNTTITSNGTAVDSPLR